MGLEGYVEGLEQWLMDGWIMDTWKVVEMGKDGRVGGWIDGQMEKYIGWME